MKSFFLWLIRFYQKTISANTPPRCKFYPTCSHYTYTAIERFGVVRGAAMGAWRILRCNPWNPGGYDPVPEKKIQYRSHTKNDSTHHTSNANEHEKSAD